jgi:hypothetical protein
MSKINLGKSVIQFKQESKRGNLYGQGSSFWDNHTFGWRTVFTCRFWVEKGEQRVGKNTRHGILEGNHCLGMF